MQEQEEKQRELLERLQKEQRQRGQREKLADAQMSNARGQQGADSLYGPVPD